MTNQLTDLNNHLFSQLERLGNSELDQESLEREVKRSSAIVNVSEQVINNAKIALDAAALVAKHGVGQWENMLPAIDGKPSAPEGRAKVPKTPVASVPNYSNETIV
jgi:hypothetical protein